MAGKGKLQTAEPRANKRTKNDAKRRSLCVAQPTYLLAHGGQYKPRHLHRKKMSLIFQKLVRNHAWGEAAPFLAVFLEATSKDKSEATNRYKHWVSTQILKHIKSGPSFPLIKSLYGAWMTKIGVDVRSSQTQEHCFAVRLESILYDIQQEKLDMNGRVNARSLEQIHGFESHSLFNTIIGLIFYQLWYSPMYSYRDNFNSWLLPVRIENFEWDKILEDKDYKNAVKYLQAAVQTTPVALLPLIQLLHIGGRERDALSQLDKFCENSTAAFPFRMRARIMEIVHPDDGINLATTYEEALKSDPSCRQTMSKLLHLHHNGHYGAKEMLEMIALHLEADFPKYSTWREFASCFLKVSQLRKDKLGAGGQNQYKIPKLFSHGKSGSTWRLRHTWWSNRHFDRAILTSEIATGVLKLLTYKASCASHLYGPQCEYVVRTRVCLEKAPDQNRKLLSFLQKHTQSSSSIELHKKLGKRSD